MSSYLTDKDFQGGKWGHTVYPMPTAETLQKAKEEIARFYHMPDTGVKAADCFPNAFKLNRS